MIETKFKETEVGRVPVDWAIYSFDDTFTFFSNNTLSRDKLGENEGKMYDVHYGDVLIKYGSILDAETERIPSIKEHYAYRTSNSITDGDIIIADTAEDETVGKVCEVQNVGNKNIVSGLHTMWVRPQDGLFAPKYLGYAMNGAIYHNQILPLIQGTKVCSVSKTAIKDTYIVVPPLPEQRRIATALSDIDSLISSLDTLIEKKRNIKQGTMQQLLTGKTRLNGFSEPWVEKKLGDVEIRNGSMLKSSEYKDGAIPVIAGGKTPAGFHSEYNREKDTITISGSGANAGYIAFYHNPIFASDCSTINEQKDFDIKFMYYTLLLKQESVYKCQAGGAQPHIHAKDISDIVLLLPTDMTEQRAIASILTSMDDEIAALEQKCEKYVALKKGMMQELLTGRIRLV